LRHVWLSSRGGEASPDLRVSKSLDPAPQAVLYVERLGRCCRLPYRVVFPLNLRVEPFGMVHTDSTTDTLVDRDGASPQDSGPSPGRVFELRSVIVHIGRDPSRGHYVTVVRTSDGCVLMDDEVVRGVEPEVLRSFYGTAGHSNSNYHQGSTYTNGTHEGTRRNDNQLNNQEPSSNGWGTTENGTGGRFMSTGRPINGSSNSTTPLYENSPEGTCCGYLLLYEAVEGVVNHDPETVVDIGSAADWISEERNLADSDSGGESGDENRGSATDRVCEDGELIQAFEQRCVPRSNSRKK